MKTDKRRRVERNIDSLLVAGLFALSGAAIVPELCAEAKRQGRITVVNAHHSNLLVGRTLGLAAHTALRLNTDTHTPAHRRLNTHSRETETTRKEYRVELEPPQTFTMFGVYTATAYYVRTERGKLS